MSEKGALPKQHNIDTFVDIHTRRAFRWLIDGNRPDLSDWSGRLRIGQYGQLVIEVADAVTTDVDGAVTLDIPAETVPVGAYSYVVDLYDANGDETRFLVGTLRVAGVFP